MRRWLLVSSPPRVPRSRVATPPVCGGFVNPRPTSPCCRLLLSVSPPVRPTDVTQCIGRPLFLWQRCGPFALTLHSLGLPRTRCGLTLTPFRHPHRSGIHSLQVSTVCKSQMRMGRSRMGRTAHKASGCTSRYARGDVCLYPHPFLRVLVRV